MLKASSLVNGYCCICLAADAAGTLLYLSLCLFCRFKKKWITILYYKFQNLKIQNRLLFLQKIDFVYFAQNAGLAFT